MRFHAEVLTLVSATAMAIALVVRIAVSNVQASLSSEIALGTILFARNFQVAVQHQFLISGQTRTRTPLYMQLPALECTIYMHRISV
jgi:hypothetical protein